MDSPDVVDGPAELTRLRLDIAYDGTGFQGWAKQPGLRTVQGELENALATVFSRFGPGPVLTVAGRTDAGVHALDQVAHVDLTREQFGSLVSSHQGKGRTPDASPAARAARLGRRLNGIAGLSSDLYVSRTMLAPPGFDARFSATWRRYRYRIADKRAPRDPLLRNQTLWYPAELDVDVMNVTARGLVGLHDFAAYCRPREGATTIRTLQHFGWERDEAGVLVALLQADAFCHSMVRALTGACVAVGEGKLKAGRAVELLRAKERTAEFKVLPAKGLALVEVGYPDDAEVGLRAEQTRARRDAATLEEVTRASSASS
ncbi:MAG TPA: tRNA pseudouridine synthase A [Galbitalea sp.]|nr:tRNA pseudouridine synthase A [Galbitalea sp.]